MARAPINSEMAPEAEPFRRTVTNLARTGSLVDLPKGQPRSKGLKTRANMSLLTRNFALCPDPDQEEFKKIGHTNALHGA